MKTILDYGAISLIGAIERADFGDNTCYDYIDSLLRAGDRYGVVVFVEPCGDIVKWGESFEQVLTWWLGVFHSQSEDMGYIEAGWHLFLLAQSDRLPDEPRQVWELDGQSGTEDADAS